MRADTVSLVRPLPWARPIGDLRFDPANWGPCVFRLDAAEGRHLVIRRHGETETAFWIPAGLAPRVRGPFGLYVHADRLLMRRAQAAAQLRRAIGRGPPLRPRRLRDAHRLAAMLCIHDLAASGLGLRDIAAEILDSMPDDWRSSSERSDLRRLAEAGHAMVDGGYRNLLHPSGHPLRRTV